ncbi:MAG: zf-HC2 domain-containing protein [Anaerolineae bacterium]|nr:zf-HC2 domain-containing protein [Anaerolineae bacterium]
MPVYTEEIMWCDAYEEEWWMRAFDGELSPDEEIMWQAHLKQCPACRLEWEAMVQVDTLLYDAPLVPSLPQDFTVRTVERVLHKQRLQQLLSFLGGFVIVMLSAIVIFTSLGGVVFSLEHAFLALYASRHLLLAALMRTVVGLLSTWQMFVPIVTLVSAIGFLLLMPNSVLATVAVVLVSRRRRKLAAI